MQLDARVQLKTLFAIHWPSAKDQRKEWDRLFLAGFLWLSLIVCSAVLALAVLQSWLAVLLALAAGVLIAWGIHRARIARLRFSRKLPEWVTCSFEEGRFICSFDEMLLFRWVCAWPWRVVSTIGAGFMCFGAQRLSIFQVSLLPLQITAMVWLRLVIHGAVIALPAVIALFFLCVAGPRRMLAEQAKRAVEGRAAFSQERIMRLSEINGFDAAMDVVFAQFRSRRPATYRNAIENRLKAEPALAMLQPESMDTMVKAVTEVARQDLKNAAGALEYVHKVEQSAHTLQLLSSVLREPLVEIKADQFMSRQQRLGELVAQRQWEDLEREAQELEKEIGEARALLQECSARPPGLMLVPGTDPYRLLGVDAAASTAAIKKLRLRLAQIYHPDIGGETSNAAKMAELNAAYDMVMRERERWGGKS